MIRLGIVVDNQDPEDLRRIRVVTQDRGTSQSQWVQRITGFNGDDSPVPDLGDTVIVASLQGDSKDEVILGVLQTATTNQPQVLKSDNLRSRFLRVLGDTWQSVSGYWSLVTLGHIKLEIATPAKPKVTITPNGTITASNQFGSVTLMSTGYVSVVDPSGTWGSSPSGLSISHSVAVNVTSPDFRWNGVQVARVGGTDSRGDTTIS